MEAIQPAAEVALAGALERSGTRATALLLVGLDDFERIRTRHGHSAGDAVLLAVEAVLRDALRGTDTTTPYGPGGDEFLVLLPARDRQLGELIARRIRARVRRAIIPVFSDDAAPVVVSNLSCSIGMAVNDPATSRRLTAAELLHQADAALLQAKSRGCAAIVVAGSGVRLAG